MPVPAAKVKTVCTESEAALVYASRGAALAKLSVAQVQRYTVRARKLTNKWEGLVRDQSRQRRLQTGVSQVDANSQLKAEIFRETLNAFEANLKTRDKAAPEGVRPSSGKRVRIAPHRATRAAVRKDLRTIKAQRNLPAAKKVTEVTTASPTPAEASTPPTGSVGKPTPKAARSRAKAKPARAASANLSESKAIPARQLAAGTAAKQARIAQGGKAGRSIGHTLARGKRAQARRDARN